MAVYGINSWNPTLVPDFVNHAGKLICGKGTADPYEAVSDLLAARVRRYWRSQHDVHYDVRPLFGHAKEVFKFGFSGRKGVRVFILYGIQKTIAPEPIQPPFVGLWKK